MSVSNRIKTLVILLAGLSVHLTSASATDVSHLQITVGSVERVPQTLSISDIDAMPQVQFTTSTIWTDEPTTFSGVPLKSVLEAAGIDGKNVEMVALNDYSVSIPVTELEENAPIIATRMNGQTMSVRDKGPFWVVYPYDDEAKYQTETAYSRSIWQLNRLNIIE